MSLQSKSLFYILVVTAVFLCGVRSAGGIGQTGHMVVAEMATGDLNKTDYPGFVNTLNAFPSERSCGSVFPDWAWPSFYQQYSRIAHTIEFQQAWTKHLKENFSSPYSEREKREVSFLMGMTTHTYDDPPWHAYFLPTAKSNDNAEEWLVEPGTDIFANWELDKRSEVTYGYFPVETAVNVYVSLGYPEVTESMLVKGILILRAAYWAEKFAGYQGYLNLVNRMPWTDDNYVTYSPGGFEYGAEVSAQEMVNTWNYLQGELDQLPLRDMPVFVERNILLELGRSLLESGAIEIPMQRTSEGEYFFGASRIVGRKSLD
ncbi:MAG: zinc dependent phospholipase C family protein [Proteobacteria bacterium]|nr:zinc dependent phospholipase C family protein [Pseudomonadota bacterium]